MTDFWDNKFREVKTMWGMEPSDSVILAIDFFLKQHICDILIPGVGYGRNAGEINNYNAKNQIRKRIA